MRTYAGDALLSAPIPSATEKVLILCRAIPEESRKYFQTVCVAGITDKGELRRLYPVIFKPFQPSGGIPFHKKEWISVNTSAPEDRRDTRRESRRVDISSVKVLSREDDNRVREIITKHLYPSVKAIEDNDATLGLIRPRILNFDCQVDDTDQWDRSKVDLYGRPIGKIKLGQESKYEFVCEERKKCCAKRPHRISIHDWEVNELYRHIIEKDRKPVVIRQKMRQKWFDWMKMERDVYFVMGTHHRWKTWMIVSVLYLAKRS